MDTPPSTPGSLEFEQAITRKLRTFAEKELQAERYPGSSHPFQRHTCQSCGGTRLRLTLEHDQGSKKNNFRGELIAECPTCGQQQTCFNFTRNPPQTLHTQKVRCRCGAEAFYLGECERIEGSDGLPGFADEGVVVAACAACERLQTVLAWD